MGKHSQGIGSPPGFLAFDYQVSTEEVFRPHPPNRRGEQIAWLSSLAIVLVNLILMSQIGRLSLFAIGLLVFFFLAALMMTLSHWVDIRTTIRVSEREVTYSSPVRKVSLRFGEIKELWVAPTGRGYRVGVLGTDRFFTFRTSSVLVGGMGRTMCIGIEDGERLTGIIRSTAGLSRPIQEGEAWLYRRSDTSS